MKKLLLSILVTAISATVMIVPIIGSASAQPPVNLGVTSTYAVLAGTTITNTGTTVINGSAGGDVGLYPGTSFTGQSTVTVSGAIHIADATALAAQNALITAYDDAAGRTPVTIVPTELGGTTLFPGVYASDSGSFQITGTLTLDAQGDPDGVFVFLTTTTLITASGSHINNINSARYCRIFWKVGSSATLGSNSTFVGHIFALTSISANTGASVQGQLLARNGGVTLDSNTIVNGICEAVVSATPTATATVVGTLGPITTGTGTTLPNTSGTPAPILIGFGLMLALAGITVAFFPKIRRVK